MDELIKFMLKKLFICYGTKEINRTSARGCFEPSVPSELAEKIIRNNINDNKNQKGELSLGHCLFKKK